MRPVQAPGDGSTGGADVAVAVQTQRLREFASELTMQAELLRSHKDSLEGLWPASTEWGLLGDFTEATALAQVHVQALARVRDLVEQLEGLVWFADSVAGEVVDRYEDADASASGSYHHVGVDDKGSAGKLV